MNKVANLIKFIDYIKTDRFSYLSNGLTNKELKDAEKAVSELYKGLCCNDKVFISTIKECFDNVVVNGKSISIGDFKLLKSGTDTTSYRNLFILEPMKAKLEDTELDKIIYKLIASLLYIDEYVNKSVYSNIDAFTAYHDCIPKIQRFQEIIVGEFGSCGRIKVLSRDPSAFNCHIIIEITSVDGNTYVLIVDENKCQLEYGLHNPIVNGYYSGTITASDTEE